MVLGIGGGEQTCVHYVYVHISISVLRGTHLHLSEVKHMKAKRLV